MHKNSINYIIEHGSENDMHELKNVFAGLVDYLKTADPEKYNQTEYKLYKIAHGNHADEELAKTWVSRMKNKDGTTGEHWSYQDTSKFAGNYDKNDFYIVMNMMYSDFYNSAFDVNTYATLAKDWLSDKDASGCKLITYYFTITAKEF